MASSSKLLFKDNEWNFDVIHNAWDVIHEIAVTKYNLDFYPPRFELIDFEGMLNAYSTYALPNLYSHWSFGKRYLQEYNKYRESASLAFEVVINSNPSICYLMDSNTATTQVLVMAHAAVGHSSFFKNNHMFKTHTRADSIIPFLARSSARIKELEAQYGEDQVETVMTYIHILRNYSFDKYKKKVLSPKQREAIKKEMDAAKDSYADKILDFDTKSIYKKVIGATDFSNWIIGVEEDAEENLLKFIYENGSNTDPLSRELIGIFLEVNQYLYPQMHTQLMNEGWASFWHYTLMKDLFEQGYIDESNYFEFIHLHCSVLNQPGIEQGYLRINPYKLGFDMYQDIKRIAMEPTQEDKDWFPDWAGNGDWLGTIKYAMTAHKDESFISQYLSPKVIRDYKFLVMERDYSKSVVTIVGDHTAEYYNKIIDMVSEHYDLFSKIPKIYVSIAPDKNYQANLYMDDSDPRKYLDIEGAQKLMQVFKYLFNGPVSWDVGPYAE